MTKNIDMNQLNIETPVMKQYWSFKNKYPDMLFFFQMGDFYELFFDDAKKASDLLNITLTKRKYSSTNIIPMAGVPCNYINSYISKLIKLGISLVICDQVGNRLLKKGLLERKIIKVITPGTVTDEDFLSDTIDNILATVYEKNNIFYYANLDLSSGRFYVSEHNTKEQLLSRIQCTNPQELLYSKNFLFKYLIKHRKGLQVRPNHEFDVNQSKKNLKLQFGTNNSIWLEIKNKHGMLSVVGCLLAYIKLMHYNHFNHIRSIKVVKNEDSIYMSSETIKHLELIENISGGTTNTLCMVLDHTVTKMGSRMLKRWLYSPLRDVNRIRNRHTSVLEFQTCFQLLKILLVQVGDLERVVTRLSLRTALPRDWLALRTALEVLPKINSILMKLKSNYIKLLMDSIGVFPDLLFLLHKSILSCPSGHIRDGNVIADGYNSKLDQLRVIKNSAKDVLLNIELKERMKFGVHSVKICCNNLIGYYIQVSNKCLNLIPIDYIKKQTLKNFSRYTFPELQQFQETFLTANFRSIELETVLYEELFDLVYPYLHLLQNSSVALSKLDVLTNLSERSITLNYSCPILTENNEIILKNSRHPIIELLSEQVFQDNDVKLTSKKKIIVITGPNMGGKSTYMRQIALIVIMSSIGSFVPAKYAKIGDIDQIFTRIGSSDNLLEGYSTFMVEMKELSGILTHVTERSLVLVDEIGRGTAYIEGLALAWSILEYFSKKIRPIMLFATHFFELTMLAKECNIIQNMFFGIFEKNGNIKFLYKIQPGCSKKSYAFLVSELAGIPMEIILSAKKKLTTFSKIKIDGSISMTKSCLNDVIKLLLAVEPDNLSPRQALDYIFFLKSKLKK